jgi:Calcineurin-like phosphoesterase
MKSAKFQLIGALFDGPIDIVGDVHGEIDALRELLTQLGYDASGEHREHRRLIFIGDLTDRGPDSPAVFDFVAKLVHEGKAQCVLGNHELNLLREARKEGNGWWFEDDHDRRDGKFTTARPLAAQRRPTLQAFLGSLPLALERSDIRLVHAAWDPPSIARIRTSASTALELYDFHEKDALERVHATGLEERARAEYSKYEEKLKDQSFPMPLLQNLATVEEIYQDHNPVRVVTSGIERVAAKPFFASGKWRMVDRVRWWNDYDESTPVIMGHYWRWPSKSARHDYSRGEPDLFAEYESHHWFGAQRNVFCVDFAVGARFKERLAHPNPSFECRLAAVRWPERELVFDHGERSRLE